MDGWLAEQGEELAKAMDVPPERLTLSQADISTLLDLARDAARDSGDRKNAPLLCYLVGRAQGEAELEDVADAVRGSSS
jgi:uncharacterized protein DUF6457